MSYGGYGIREERRERKVSMQPAKNDSKSRGRLLAGLGLLGPGETFGARPDLADGGNTSDSVNTGEGSAVVSARSAVLEVGLCEVVRNEVSHNPREVGAREEEKRTVVSMHSKAEDPATEQASEEAGQRLRLALRRSRARPEGTAASWQVKLQQGGKGSKREARGRKRRENKRWSVSAMTTESLSRLWKHSHSRRGVAGKGLSGCGLGTVLYKRQKRARLVFGRAMTTTSFRLT